ncbi:MAG: mevalonate kinase [Bacteroidales bacterium]
MQAKHHYYSKLLLFGEYSILLDSSALSIPYSHFQAELSYIKEDKYTDYDQAVTSNQLIKEFVSYLNTGWQGSSEILNLEELNKSTEAGLYFESTIPQGYGLGSSGALCAAIYEHFAYHPIPVTENISKEDIHRLRQILSGMESFFHGKSSGIDPLAIYLRAPLFIGQDGSAKIVGIPRSWDSQSTGIFLIDTGKPGKTNSLVPAFLEKFAPEGKITQKGKELSELNNDCIHHLLMGDINPFWEKLSKLSVFQLNHLQEIIPESMYSLWEEGIESKLYNFKICGSGGGGFLIGFAKDYKQAKTFLKSQGIQTIPVYLAV